MRLLMGSYSWTKLLSQSEVRESGVLGGLLSPVRMTVFVFCVWPCSPSGAPYTDPLYAAYLAKCDVFYWMFMCHWPKGFSYSPYISI